MAEQRLEPVADRHLAQLRFVHDRDRHLGGCTLVDEDVAHPRVVRDHRNRRLRPHLPDQPRSAARNHEIDRVREPEQDVDRSAVDGRHDRDRRLRNPDLAGCRPELCAQGEVRVDRLGAPAQDDGVARLEAERRRIDGHVGARFVDHRDDAERDRHLADAQTVRPHAVVRDAADGIGERCDVGESLEHVLPLAVGEPEASAERRLDALLGGARDVLRVGGEDALARALEASRGTREPLVLLARRELGRDLARRAGGAGELAHLRLERGRGASFGAVLVGAGQSSRHHLGLGPGRLLESSLEWKVVGRQSS